MAAFYNSFRRKLVLLCMSVLFLVIGVMHVSVYITTKNIITNQIGVGAQSTATAIAGRIMADAEGYRRFMETRDTHSEYYRQMQEYLARVKASGDAIRFIYTERPVDADTVEFLLDAEPVGSPDYSAPGDTTFMDVASREVYATGLPAILAPTEHPDYGTLLGGCAPIFDANGKPMGLVGVNLDISELNSQLWNLQLVMLCLYGVISFAILVLIHKYSSLILEPMIKDKMTGAYNRRYYGTLMRRAIKQAKRRGARLALLLLDLDHFKNVNDTYGHAFGDTVLGAVAKTVMSCLRQNDYFIRYGGEEFAVIIANTDTATVLKIAERIRATVENAKIRNAENTLTITATISIGVALLDGQRDSERGLMDKADKALYAAKVTRNAVSLFQEKNQAGAGVPAVPA